LMWPVAPRIEAADVPLITKEAMTDATVPAPTKESRFTPSLLDPRTENALLAPTARI